MAIGSGISAQLGFKTESVWATPVTVDSFVPLISESMGQEIERVESAGIMAGRQFLTSSQWAAGNKMVGGDLGLELYVATMRDLLKHMIGSETGIGPYTYSPANNAGLGLTVQIGVPDVSGTVRTKTYAGTKIASWEIACAAGQIVTLGLSCIAKNETTATALASASYAANSMKPFVFSGATATIAAGAVNVKQLTLAGNNNLERRFFLGSQETSEPNQTALTEVTGSMQLEFGNNFTDYNRFVNGTEAALVVTFASGTSSVVATLNVRFDGETPKVGGRGIVDQPLPFKAIASGADSTAIQIVYTL